MTEKSPETSIVEIIVAEAARHHKRFDSLEQSMLAMQTELCTEIKEANQALRDEMKEAITQSDKNMTKAIQDFRTEMKDAIAQSDKNRTKAISELKTEIKTAAAEMKTDMLWVKRLSIASFVTLLGALLASALAVLININI